MAEKNTPTRVKKKRSHPMFPGRKPAWEIAYLFPAQGTWTESDYWDLTTLHDRRPLVELSNGCLEVLPMPTELHQLIAALFYELLRAFTQTHAPGIVLFSGLRLRLKKGRKARFREPDVVYLKAENAHLRHAKFWDRADLAMEIVSDDPKDRKRDLETKPREYAEAGIPEYWIIDPEQQRVRVLTLEGGAYKVHGDFGPGTLATSVLLPGFAVAVDQLLAPPGSQPSQ
jgi:Uma2 family endonuclease